jgi:hypothetical protein
MISSKKGGVELSANLLIGIIMGMVVIVAIGVPTAAIAQSYLGSKAGIEDMKVFIEGLEDGTSDDLRLEFPDEYILLSFANGADYGNSENVADSPWMCPFDTDGYIFKWQINFPEDDEACSTGNCVCACKKSLFGTALGPGACNSFSTSCISFDTEYTPQFVDPDCDWGIFRESTSGDVLTLNAMRRGDLVYLCEEENCIPEEDQEAYEQFLTFIEDYKLCLEKDTDCTCELDFDFLSDEYALNFYSDKVSLYKIESEYDLAIEEFTTNYDVNSTNEELQSDLSLYTFQEYYISGAVEADAFPITFDYLVISPLNDFHTFDSTLEDNQMKISETLVKTNNGLILEDASHSSELASCKEESTEQQPLVS